MLSDSQIIIKFFEDKAQIVKDKYIDIKNINLPGFANYFERAVFLKVSVLAIDLSENSLFVDIKTYHSGQIVFGQAQNNEADLLSQIEKIKFKNIGTFELIKIKNAKKDLSIRPKREKFIQEQEVLDKNFQNNMVKPSQTITNKKPVSKKPNTNTIKDYFQLNIKDLSFHYGYVSFYKWVPALNQEVEFSIVNHNIREEFDAIKNYFSNILKTKRVDISTKIVIKDDIVELAEARSEIIEEIDENFIDSLKIDYIKKLKKKKLPSHIDKTLFTMEEYFEAFSDEKINPDTFYSNDLDLLEDLIDISNTKHYQNLRYLSSKHAFRIMKLRFVLKPFSFLFLVEGADYYHVIWETLDSREATYIWRVDKEIKILKHNIKQIEGLITQISMEGKKAYLIHPDANFRRIFHDYSALVNGFVKWKGELDSVLI